MATIITKDISFDLYGDIKFNYGDITLIDDIGDIFYQNAMERIITNFGDIKTLPESGADLNSSIGKTVNNALQKEIENKIIYSLTVDNFLSNNEIEVITVPQDDKIFVRVNLYINGSTNQVAGEKVTINCIYNISSGLMYANI